MSPPSLTIPGRTRGVDQLADLGGDLGVVAFFDFVPGVPGLVPAGEPAFAGAWVDQHRPVGQEMLHDDAEDGGLEELPVGVGRLGHGDEVGPQRDPGNCLDLEQPRRQRRALRRPGIVEADVATLEHAAAGQELQGIGVGRRFRLDEHCSASRRITAIARLVVNKWPRASGERGYAGPDYGLTP